MSDKKVNSKMLKDLIKEVLEEKRLDEKKYYTKDGEPAFGDALKTYDGVADLKSSPVFNKDVNGKAFEKIAAQSKDGKVSGEEPLTYADLEAASKLGKQSKARKYFDATVDAGVKAKVADNTTKTKTKTKTKTTPKASTDPAVGTATPLGDKLATNDIDTRSKPGEVNPFGQFPKAYSPDVSTSSSRGTKGKGWVKWDDIKKNVKADPLLYSTFSSIDGDTAIAKWTSILNFATAAMKGSSGLDTWYTGTAGGNEFKLVNYSFVLSLLADTSKVTDSTNAGNFFEGFLFYLLGAPILGKGGKAIDNATKLNDNSVLYMSAKFYANIGGISQAYSNLVEDTRDFGSVYYMSLVKSGQTNPDKDVSGGQFDQLNLHYTEIYAEGTKIKARAIDGDGKLIGKSWVITKTGTKGVIFGSGSDTTPALTIPVLPAQSGKATATQLAAYTASYLSKEVQKTSATKAAAVTKVLEELTSMDQKVKQFSGEKAEATPSAAKTKAFMKGIYSSYVTATSSYQTIFKGETGEQFSSVVAPTPKQESKKITSKMLKKLFKETLKK